MLAFIICALLGLSATRAATPSESPVSATIHGVDEVSTERSGTQERWLEVIEVYTLPFDPAWRETALCVHAVDFDDYFPGEAEKLALRSRLEERARRRESVRADLEATAERPMPLSVMRAWDGIRKTEVVVTFGRGQRSILNRFKPDRPIFVEVEPAAPGEDYQSRRPTVRGIKSSSRVPSELAPARDSSPRVWSVAFGELAALPTSEPFSVRTTKDPTPGSGVLTVVVELPTSNLEFTTNYPWYAQFKLFELAKNGKRAREVEFNGTNAVVSISPQHGHSVQEMIATRGMQTAIGRVEVKSPQPWGYEAEIVRWFGVAPKSMLKPSSKPGKAIGGDESSGSDASPPSAAEDDPLAVPTTPEIPDDS